MKNIIEYFDNILDTEGYDAWEEANARAWELYERDDDSFIAWAAAEGIDLEASRPLLRHETPYLSSWVWDNLDE